MQVAAEHAEAVCQRARVGMEEWFLLNGVALHSPHVAPGNVKLASCIEPDFADPRLTFRNGTAVAAGIATNAIAIDRLVQLALADILIENFAKGRQRGYL